MVLPFPEKIAKQRSATLKKCGAFDDDQKGGAFDVMLSFSAKREKLFAPFAPKNAPSHSGLAWVSLVNK